MSLAEEYFYIKNKCDLKRDEVEDAILSALGVNPDEPQNWPVQDFILDSYDTSFELLEVKPGWMPTDDQFKAVFTLGFVQCWLNFINGSTYHRNQSGSRGWTIK